MAEPQLVSGSFGFQLFTFGASFTPDSDLGGSHMDTSDIVSAVLGFLAGISLKIVIDRRKSDTSTTTTNQSNSKVGGDQVGRDKYINSRDK
jgi:glycopeptide antibiotics resistance protein